MVKCPKCKSEDYEVKYVGDYNYQGDEIITLVNVRCCECNKEFWVKEFFTFSDAKYVW